MSSKSKRIPMCLIVDDPCPGVNPLHYHHPDEGHVRDVPPRLIHDVADLFEEFGVRGKFSLLPYPMGLGRIDRHVDGVPDSAVEDFVSVVRDRIARLFDITPEILTHMNAVDLTGPGRLLDVREDKYFTEIDAETMTDYIALALEILRNVGIDATGVTSPWALGNEREEDYVRAILAAQKRANRRSRTWYFLHTDQSSKILQHAVKHRSEGGDEWVVSIVSGQGDFIWATQYGNEPDIDGMITADGAAGRLVELVRAGGPVAFHTHWQSIFSNGTFRGLSALRDLFRRIEQNLGEEIRWTKCSELAALVATSHGPTE